MCNAGQLGSDLEDKVVIVPDDRDRDAVEVVVRCLAFLLNIGQPSQITAGVLKEDPGVREACKLSKGGKWGTQAQRAVRRPAGPSLA